MYRCPVLGGPGSIGASIPFSNTLGSGFPFLELPGLSIHTQVRPFPASIFRTNNGVGYSLASRRFFSPQHIVKNGSLGFTICQSPQMRKPLSILALVGWAVFCLLPRPILCTLSVSVPTLYSPLGWGRGRKTGFASRAHIPSPVSCEQALVTRIFSSVLNSCF